VSTNFTTLAKRGAIITAALHPSTDFLSIMEFCLIFLYSCAPY
jgi:hypothetical protein